MYPLGATLDKIVAYFIGFLDPTLSEVFTINNGVKQGGILSPILFCIYIDELMHRRKESGVGCQINSVYFGSFAYADDICLLAPRRNSTQDPAFRQCY